MKRTNSDVVPILGSLLIGLLAAAVFGVAVFLGIAGAVKDPPEIERGPTAVLEAYGASFSKVLAAENDTLAADYTIAKESFANGLSGSKKKKETDLFVHALDLGRKKGGSALIRFLDRLRIPEANLTNDAIVQVLVEDPARSVIARKATQQDADSAHERLKRSLRSTQAVDPVTSLALEELSRSVGRFREAYREHGRNSWLLVTRRLISGWLQFCMGVLFWFAVALLLGRHLVQGLADAALARELAGELAPDGAQLAPVEDAHSLGEGASFDSDRRAWWRTFTPRRRVPGVVLKVATGAFLQSGSVGETRDALGLAMDEERQELESSYGPIRYAIWAIPSIGFVGTVLGISSALSEAHQVVTTTGSWRQEGAIQLVTSQLGVAFDTTFVALLLSIVLMLIYHTVERYQESVLIRMQDQYLTYLNRLSSEDRTAVVKHLIDYEVERIRNAIRDSLEEAMLRDREEGLRAQLAHLSERLDAVKARKSK